jgi:hypothetical protein
MILQLRLAHRIAIAMTLMVLLAFPTGSECKDKPERNTSLVVLSTTLGDITIQLYPDKAPMSVTNFLTYVDSGFYNGTIFHRVIPGFMIQGGGFTDSMQSKPTRPPMRYAFDGPHASNRQRHLAVLHQPCG